VRRRARFRWTFTNYPLRLLAARTRGKLRETEI